MSKKPGHEEQEDGQLVTSATVHFRERWSWAWHRVDASDFFQSVGAAVLAGVLVVIAAPQDPVAVATMAAIGGASLMFGANLLWNLYHHARPEILADRLTAAGEKIAQLDYHADEKVAWLAALCALGQNALATPVKSEADREGWLVAVAEIMKQIAAVMPFLTAGEVLKLRHADPEGIAFDRAFDEKHRFEWCKLKCRVIALQEIVTGLS